MEGGQDTSKSLICAVRVGRVERVRVLVHLVHLKIVGRWDTLQDSGQIASR